MPLHLVIVVHHSPLLSAFWNSMIHITQRLAERGIDIASNDLQRLAMACNRATAIILAHTPKRLVSGGNIGSNGDLVILIVRQCRPVTIMFRRSEQPMTCEALHVSEIIDKS